MRYSSQRNLIPTQQSTIKKQLLNATTMRA